MPVEFAQWVQRAVSNFFWWPSNRQFGNSFSYLYEQYTANVMTNIRTHAKRRIKLFFTMRVYELNDMQSQLNAPNPIVFTDQDVKNAVKYTMERRDNTNGDAGAQNRLGILLDELIDIGAPADCNIVDFLNTNWFKSLYMWMQIQRDIQHFQHAFAHVRNSWSLYRKFPRYVQRPTTPEPPEIHNFVAIPTCSFQRRHIRIDTDVLYRLLCETKLVPKKDGIRKDKVNIKSPEFSRDQYGNWNRVFDLSQIYKMVHGKKTFDFQILSDGVSVTMLYLKQTTAAVPISREEVVMQYDAGLFFYELGIDPGMRTWNATVRRNIKTGEEVNTNILII